MARSPFSRSTARSRHFGTAAILQSCLIVTSAAAQTSAKIADCGTGYAAPFADPAPRRCCPDRAGRLYQPQHKGIGYDILSLESEACFVPDSAFALLDQIVDRALAKLTSAERTGKGILAKARAIAVSKATSDTLGEMGFGLYIPTETLSDALVSRAAPGQPAAYIEDCDTASLILMTVADALNLPTNLVEITLHSGSQHNYVHWPLGGRNFVNWDTNARDVCQTPAGQPAYQGKAMTRKQTMAYAYRLREALWKQEKEFDRAASDDLVAMRDWPANPAGYNNFAWTVATGDWPARESLLPQALAAANQAIRLQSAAGKLQITKRDLGNYHDTLACLYAYAGDFKTAVNIERKAIGFSSTPEFEKRLALFSGASPKDCTGGP